MAPSKIITRYGGKPNKRQYRTGIRSDLAPLSRSSSPEPFVASLSKRRVKSTLVKSIPPPPPSTPKKNRTRSTGPVSPIISSVSSRFITAVINKVKGKGRGRVMRLPSPASSSSSSDCEEPVVLDDEFERGLESESEPESESDSSRPTKKARKGQYQLETPEITPTKVSRRVQLVEEELASEETDETLIATEEEEEEEEDEMEVDLEERRKSKGKGREVVLDEEIELEIDENIGEEDEDEEREIDSDDDPDVRVEKVDKGKGRAIEVDESMDLDESDLTGVIADDAEEEESDDSDDSTTTPSKKSKPSHRTPQKRRRSSRSPTPLFNFGSARNRGLPASVSKLHSTHSNLRIDTIGYSQQQHKTDAVGWIIEKEVGVVESQGERFVNRATATAEEEDDKPAYATELMKKMISQVGAVLTGNQRFSPMTPTKKFDPRIVKEYPMVEGLERWEKEVRYMIEGVVTKGVGTCVVLLGQRGVGKTLIVERSIEIVQTVHGDDSFIPVRLNGLSQTTDRLAMREIARQLSKDGIIEEGADFGSHSATMTTLLRLLEPPTESSLPELPSTSTSPAHHDKPIIFIIDEFDQFAQISRQSFLYSLLDIVQGNKRKSGVGVIGISSRNDCLSLLEKRVRSRCQSQVLEIAPVLNFTTFLKLAQSLLSVDVIVAKKRSRVEGELAKDWNLEIDSFLKDAPVREYLQRLWYLHGNIPIALRQSLVYVYQQLEWEMKMIVSAGVKSREIRRLDVTLFPPAAKSATRNDLISGLTILELSLCIAAKHLRDDSGDQMNLEMLHDVYSQHVRRGKLGIAAKGFTKNAFAMAFDHLRSLEIFLPLSGHPPNFITPSHATSFKLFRFVPLREVISEVVEGRDDVSQPLKRWCKNWMA